ncbi:MAG: hypothetical protein F2667_11065 [Actinobacteria bacterium]|uniref:Unannotated protein n=1 Tax=freshwater metagenome TaxID=449393 RepID=A0A6J6RKW5_9ZZZZ|nr:hypothetical protein [Actinomycetota bacterium]
MSQVTLIGDVVASREAIDRLDLHQALQQALREVNAHYETDLRITVGDEYQGAVPSLGLATRIALDLRLALLPTYDVRHGIGVGAVRLLDPETRVQDGPGWWAAREAIEQVAALESQAATRTARTWVSGAGDASVLSAVNAALGGRDELVGRLDRRSLSVLAGILAGRTQRQLAEEEHVSASAISQRVRADALGTVAAMTERLERVEAGRP